MTRASYYKEHLQLVPHPEGGHYAEVYRSALEIEMNGFDGKRNLCTSIFFLLEAHETSALHRIKSDELWYYHDGDVLEIIEMDESGNEVITRLGKLLHEGCKLQHVVKAGRWFGARPAAGSEFCLVGCQVSPGFDFRDFELK
ncbi:MAG: cupin domain-containing protein [Flavobacteriales bacterium]|jgi:predicted cupin superfamily sugar epimerase